MFSGSHICFTSHKVRTAEQKKVLKKRGAGGFFGPAVKNGRNYGLACSQLKMGEIQKKNFLKALPLYGLLMAKSQFFSQTYHIGARARYA